MHREIVEERGWVSEEQFLQALNFCHFLPGPEAQQLATWIGWKLHGMRGGFAMGLLFVVPGALVILALSMLYALAADLHWFAALFTGIKAAVLAIVVQALIRIAGRALKTPLQKALAVGAFVALAGLALPFPLVVLSAGVIGFATAAARPELLGLNRVDAPPLTTLCRPVLHGAAGGRHLRLAACWRDGRWPRPCRDDTGAADHGNPVRRLSRRFPRARTVLANGRRTACCGADDVGDFRPLLHLDLRLCQSNHHVIIRVSDNILILTLQE